MTTTITDLEQRLARVEELLQHVPEVRAALRSLADAEARDLYRRVLALTDPAERCAAWSALAPIEQRRCLEDLDLRGALAFVDGFAHADLERAVAAMPDQLRDPVEARCLRKMPARVRVSVAQGTDVRTLGHQLGKEDPRGARLLDAGLQRYVDERHGYYAGFACDRLMAPEFTRDGWEALLAVDDRLRALVDRGALRVEELDREQSIESQLAEWQLHSVPRHQGIERVPYLHRRSR